MQQIELPEVPVHSAQLQVNEDMAGGGEELYRLSTSTAETPLLPVTLMSKDGYPRMMRPWPRPLAVALCILGIWQPGTAERAQCRAAGSRGCGRGYGGNLSRVYSHHPIASARGMDSNGNAVGVLGADHDGPSSSGAVVEEHSPPLSWSQSVGGDECRLDAMYCDICSSKYEVSGAAQTGLKTADNKIRPLLLNVLLFLYLISIVGLMTYDFVVYMSVFWGKQENVLFLVSYLTYLLQVFVAPVFALLTRCLTWLSFWDPERTWAALQSDYIFKRSQYLHESCAASFVSLGLFLAWPASNGLLRLAYDEFYRPQGNVHAEISHWCAFASYIIYGAFCYLVYVERLSFQNEFRAVVHFVASNAPKGDAALDVCRDRLSTAYRQFRIQRDFVGIWMAFTMAVATWGITAHLTWNYVIYSYCDTAKDGGLVVAGLPLLNVLIWSQKIMFFVLPSVAVGGLNLDYIWLEFRYIMANHMRHRYRAFWCEIMHHISEINLFGKALTATLVFSVLGLYLGLELSNNAQNVAFWNGPGEFNGTIFCKGSLVQS